MQWSKPHSAPCCPEDGVQHYTELAGSGQGALLGAQCCSEWTPSPPQFRPEVRTWGAQSSPCAMSSPKLAAASSCSQPPPPPFIF